MMQPALVGGGWGADEPNTLQVIMQPMSPFNRSVTETLLLVKLIVISIIMYLFMRARICRTLTKISSCKLSTCRLD